MTSIVTAPGKEYYVLIIFIMGCCFGRLVVVDGSAMPSLSYKKWSLPGQQRVNDIASVGKIQASLALCHFMKAFARRKSLHAWRDVGKSRECRWRDWERIFSWCRGRDIEKIFQFLLMPDYVSVDRVGCVFVRSVAFLTKSLKTGIIEITFCP